jgi:ABC-type Na+ efflux pump permease subunit
MLIPVSTPFVATSRILGGYSGIFEILTAVIMSAAFIAICNYIIIKVLIPNKIIGRN